jgi:hypothetical protein
MEFLFRQVEYFLRVLQCGGVSRTDQDLEGRLRQYPLPCVGPGRTEGIHRTSQDQRGATVGSQATGDRVQDGSVDRGSVGRCCCGCAAACSRGFGDRVDGVGGITGASADKDGRQEPPLSVGRVVGTTSRDCNCRRRSVNRRCPARKALRSGDSAPISAKPAVEEGCDAAATRPPQD